MIDPPSGAKAGRGSFCVWSKKVEKFWFPSSVLSATMEAEGMNMKMTEQYAEKLIDLINGTIEDMEILPDIPEKEEMQRLLKQMLQTVKKTIGETE